MNDCFVLTCLWFHLFVLNFGGFNLLTLYFDLLLMLCGFLLERLNWFMLHWFMLHWFMLHWCMFSRFMLGRFMLGRFMLGSFVFRSFILFMFRYLFVLNRMSFYWFLLRRFNLFFFIPNNFLLLALFMLFLLLFTWLSSVFSKGLFELFRNVSYSSPIFRVLFLLSS